MNANPKVDLRRYRGALLGLAAGDAVGTTVEFRSRGSFEPVTDMVGGGPFGLRPGEWTDDTSMALCLGSSLLECGGFDARDQMERYCRWWKEGEWSSNGRCFDIGSTCSSALRRFERTGEPFAGSTDTHSAGNGSIMRLAPVVLFYHPHREAILHYAAESSRTTHGTLECVEACRLLAAILHAALDGQSREEVLRAGQDLAFQAPKIEAIARGTWREKPEEEIRGTGYVVQSLEAALACFARSRDFRDAILRAVNLGDDADTTAAVCGQIAGAFYGEEGIPEAWLRKLARGWKIAEMAEALGRARPEGQELEAARGAAPEGTEAPPETFPRKVEAEGRTLPLPQGYVVLPGRFYAGEYPGHSDPELARARIEGLEALGVRAFVDLTTPADALEPYAPYLRRAVRENHPIPDVSVPRRREDARLILDALDRHLEAGRPVYLHCLGGVGRTGLVVGCWLVRHGLSGEAALRRLAELWRTCPKVSRKPKSPETPAQKAFVRTWREEGEAAG